MKTNRKSATTLAATMAMILAVPAAALADGGRDGDRGRGPGWHKGVDDHPPGWNRGGNRSNEHYNIHYRNTYYSHYAGPKHYYPRHYPQYTPAYGCSNCGKKHHHNNHDHDNDKLWIGLLGGGILGYGLGVSPRAVTPQSRTSINRLPTLRRHLPSTPTRNRPIHACSSASTTRRSWSAENRSMVTARPAFSRMARGATVQPNRSHTEVSLRTYEFG